MFSHYLKVRGIVIAFCSTDSGNVKDELVLVQYCLKDEGSRSCTWS